MAEGNLDPLRTERTLVLLVEGNLVLLAAEGNLALWMVDGDGPLCHKLEPAVVAAARDSWVGSSFGDMVLLLEEGRADTEMDEVDGVEGTDMMAAAAVLGMNWNWEGILELNMPLDWALAVEVRISLSPVPLIVSGLHADLCFLHCFRLKSFAKLPGHFIAKILATSDSRLCSPHWSAVLTYAGVCLVGSGHAIAQWPDTPQL
jgi:hypothetical protein